MGGGRSTCSTSSSKAMLGGVAVVCLVWLLVVGMLETTERTTALGVASKAKSDCGYRSLKRMEETGKEKMDMMNYMSKRRVPNGPDPIHNRGARNSIQPPGIP